MESQEKPIKPNEKSFEEVVREIRENLQKTLEIYNTFATKIKPAIPYGPPDLREPIEKR